MGHGAIETVCVSHEEHGSTGDPAATATYKVHGIKAVANHSPRNASGDVPQFRVSRSVLPVPGAVSRACNTVCGKTGTYNKDVSQNRQLRSTQKLPR